MLRRAFQASQQYNSFVFPGRYRTGKPYTVPPTLSSHWPLTPPCMKGEEAEHILYVLSLGSGKPGSGSLPLCEERACPWPAIKVT